MKKIVILLFWFMAVTGCSTLSNDAAWSRAAAESVKPVSIEGTLILNTLEYNRHISVSSSLFIAKELERFLQIPKAQQSLMDRIKLAILLSSPRNKANNPNLAARLLGNISKENGLAAHERYLIHLMHDQLKNEIRLVANFEREKQSRKELEDKIKALFAIEQSMESAKEAGEP